MRLYLFFKQSRFFIKDIRNKLEVNSMVLPSYWAIAASLTKMYKYAIIWASIEMFLVVQILGN